jgi:hypothetical protein
MGSASSSIFSALMAPITRSSSLLVSKDLATMRAVIGGNDVRMGWLERLIENAATTIYPIWRRDDRSLLPHILCSAKSHNIRFGTAEGRAP